MNLKLKQIGIGLLELMLSLAIIAILLVMATRYYQVASFSEKVNQDINLIGNIEAAANRWKAIYGDYKKITSIQDLIDQGMQDISAYNAWAGTVDVVSNTEGSGIEITLNNIPYKACNNLLDKFLTQNLIPTCSGFSGTVTFTMKYN